MVSKRSRSTTVPRPLSRAVVPGYTRTGGFYGRFSGPGGELKFFDTALSFSVDATGEIPATGQLALIPQGNAENNRIGRKCTVKSIELGGTATWVPAASATGGGQVVMYLVQDTQTNGAVASVIDVFESVNLTYALRELANEERFKVLKKITMTFNAAAGVSGAYAYVTRSWSIKKRLNIPLEFASPPAADITDLKTNNLFLIAGTNSTSDDSVVVQGNCRLRFSDN